MPDQPVPALNRRHFIAATAGVSLMATTGSAAAKDASNQDIAGKTVLGMVVFDGFELLDVFGPLEMFGLLRDKVRIVMIAERAGAVKSSAGPAVIADHGFADAPRLDIVMLPGGMGTRREVTNVAFVDSFRALADATPKVATICTGSAVLAKTGLIDGVKATTNKRSYAWATGQGAKVVWMPQARWVEDGKYISSSGISAGMDMALALIASLYGRDEAVKVANAAEYRWHEDATDDPFAKINGLVK